MNKIKWGLRHYLKRLPLCLKVFILSLASILNFYACSFIPEKNLSNYLTVMTIALIPLLVLSFFVLESKALIVTIKLWIVGCVFTLVVATILIYMEKPLSPYLSIEDKMSNWLYAFTYPMRILAIFLCGLMFLEITSPIEFMQLGSVGLLIAFLLRIIGYAKNNIYETIEYLKMCGLWPEENKKLFNINEVKAKVKICPILVSIVFRNIVCWSLPWAWISFNRFRKEIYGEQE